MSDDHSLPLTSLLASDLVYFLVDSLAWLLVECLVLDEYSSRLLIPLPRSKLYKSLKAIKCLSPPKMYMKSLFTQIV
jgi:hypothetical protein